ncbi:TRAP transporter large permease [Nesterenkonia ebinurensis]|uniref:TRAP transporter large permease n=1 Tax=Nesterenkonia ebinurensis TaxID=2608252 RepID=UPI00123CE2BC|nr:TRAP transporter large permease [Nesterenkonia ebinurensis]
MDPIAGGIIALCLALLLLGVHVGFALLISGGVGLFLLAGFDTAWAQLSAMPYSASAIESLSVIPLFILMGMVFYRADYTKEIFDVAFRWVGGLRGGSVNATTLASGIFGAITGSSVAAAGVFSKVALPEMVRRGVDKRLAAGSIAAAGTVASMIPPSMLLVMYGIITESSVAMLLTAGLLPGLLTILVYCVGVNLGVRLKPELAPTNDERYSWWERISSMRSLWGIVVIFAIVMGGIYQGFFTVTQAAAVGSAAAILLAVVQQKLKVKGLRNSFVDAAAQTSSLMIIIVGGAVFARFLSYSGLVSVVSRTLEDAGLPSWVYLLIYILLFIALGMFLEGYSMMVLALPIMFPLMMNLGFDPIWLGIITVKLAEIGLMTPPVGLNVFVVKSSSPVPITLKETFSGVWPFLVLELVTLTILVLFPAIALFLPETASS